MPCRGILDKDSEGYFSNGELNVGFPLFLPNRFYLYPYAYAGVSSFGIDELDGFGIGSAFYGAGLEVHQIITRKFTMGLGFEFKQHLVFTDVWPARGYALSINLIMGF